MEKDDVDDDDDDDTLGLEGDCVNSIYQLA